MAIFVAAIGFWAKHTRSRAAKPHRFSARARDIHKPPLKLRGYLVWGSRASVRGESTAGRVSRSATAFNFCI